MQADALDPPLDERPVDEHPVDAHLRRFADYVGSQGGHPLTYADFVACASRAELGISSLDMLILVAGYIDATAGGSIVLQPEWVPMLDDVAGIRAVVAEIDTAAAAAGGPAG